MIKGLSQTQLQKVLDFLKLVDKLPFGLVDPDVFDIDSWFTNLRNCIDMCKSALRPIPDSDELKGYAQKTKAEYEISQLPENYYKLKIGTCTCKIVLSGRSYDYEKKCFYNNSKRKVYAIKSIGWTPRLYKKCFKVVPYDNVSKVFGAFNTLDECKHLWYVFVQEMLELNGFNPSKNLELFNSITRSIEY